MVSLLLLSTVFLLSVNKAISQCPPPSGIYLKYDGNCYSNGSYFWDNNIKPTPIECGLPGATMDDGQWIGPNGTVPCPGSNSNLNCNVGLSGASLSVHIPATFQVYLQPPGDGWYKCCLPTNCSDPNTNIIFANIFRFAQILSFTVTGLSSDMTVYPQEYKLICTKIGHGYYGISMRIGNTTLASYTYCIDKLICSPCPGSVLVSSTHTV
ncbi:PREDICTED: uncharacterized protein LOC109591462, partial [Amphimedon queenslandica]|uniref:Sushi domain-containing protein n=2 Tax=Amphimedon queenslandica TaxID=400682 RepID=A0AAN0K060_AMPQE